MSVAISPSASPPRIGGAVSIPATSLFNESGEREMSPTIVGPAAGKSGHLGGVGVRFMAWGAETGGGFSLVEHPMAPRALAAPLHRHSREDEYSYVLEGRMGADLGGEIVHAEAGDLVFKPRGEWHTFWNAGDVPCRILEIISPAGFERYFDELVDFTEAPTADTVAPVAAKYGLEVDPASIPALCERHGLRFPAEPLLPTHA